MKRITPIILVAIAQFYFLPAKAQGQQTLDLYLETGHTTDVGSVIFHPDGKSIISTAGDKTMKLWDITSGSELDTVPAPSGVYFSPDEKTAVLSDWKAKTIILWDVASWRRLHTLSWEGNNDFAFFSVNKKTVAAWNAMSLKIWDIASGQELYARSVQLGALFWVYPLQNGNTMALLTGGKFTLLDVTSGRELHSFSADDSYRANILSPDGKMFASWNNTSLNLRDTASGQKLQTLSADFKSGNVLFSPDWKTVALHNYITGIRLWDLTSGRELNGLSGPIINVVFSPNGKTLAFTFGAWNNMSIGLWDVGSVQSPRHFKERTGNFSAILFSPDGKIIALGSYSSTNWSPNTTTLVKATLWDVDSGQELHLTQEPSSFSLSLSSKTAVTWAPGGDTIRLLDPTSWREIGVLRSDSGINDLTYSLNGKKILSWNDKVLKLWDVNAGRELYTLEGSVGTFPRFALSPNAKKIVSMSGDKITLWDLTRSQPLHTLKGSAFPVDSFALSPDGKTLATWYGRNKVLKLWDVALGKEIRTIFWNEISGQQPHHAGKSKPNMFLLIPLVAVFSPDGKKLAIWILNESIFTLWDVASGQKLHTFSAPIDGVGQVAFSPNGETIASGGGTAVNLWDTATGALRRKFKGYETGPLVFSPDGTVIVSWRLNPQSTDHPIKVWNTASGWGEQTLEGHSQPITAVAFASDNRTLASASSDHTIKLWDLTTGQALRVLGGHNGPVNSVAFNSERTLLVSASSDGTTRLWDVGSGQVLKVLQSDDPATRSEVRSLAPDFYVKSRSDLLSRAGEFQIVVAENGRINLSDVKTGAVSLSLVALGESEWVVTTPEGRFDTNKSLDRIEGLHWIVNGETLNPQPLDVFMRQYYEPGLMRRSLNGEQFKSLPSIATINRVQPSVAVREIKPAAAGFVNVTVEVGNVTEDVSVSAADRTKKKRLSSGVFDVRLFRDGQLVGHSTPDEKLHSTFRTYKDFDAELNAWREANRVDLINGKMTFNFKVKLPSRPDGKQVEFSAYAFNSDRVKSRTEIESYTIPDDAKLNPAPRRAYVITFGANKYDNPEWDLQFAGGDAQAISETVSVGLRAHNEFAEVVEIPLISDNKIINGQTVERRDANKGNVRAVLELLAGKAPSADRLKNLERALGAEILRKIRQASPDDMILIAFSSHGYADKNGTFYIVPTDIGKDRRKRVTAELISRSISSDELSLWLRDVDAGEMVMIVDACHSASAVEGGDFKPGPMGSRGLGQLAFDKGMRILTATQSDSVAFENKRIKQGLLTYALVRDGIRARQADFRPKDNLITVAEWLAYGVERVPKLYQEIKENRVQAFGLDTGQQAKLVLTLQGGERNNESGGKTLEEIIVEGRSQQPSLFDFTKRRKEVVLVK